MALRVAMFMEGEGLSDMDSHALLHMRSYTRTHTHTHTRTRTRRFLVHFQSQILAHNHSSAFNFRNGSIGNFFFAGSRTFFMWVNTVAFILESNVYGELFTYCMFIT